MEAALIRLVLSNPQGSIRFRRLRFRGRMLDGIDIELQDAVNLVLPDRTGARYRCLACHLSPARPSSRNSTVVCCRLTAALGASPASPAPGECFDSASSRLKSAKTSAMSVARLGSSAAGVC